MGYFVTLKTFDNLSQNNVPSSQNNIVYLKELIFISMHIYLRLSLKYALVSCSTYCKTFH